MQILSHFGLTACLHLGRDKLKGTGWSITPAFVLCVLMTYHLETLPDLPFYHLWKMEDQACLYFWCMEY